MTVDEAIVQAEAAIAAMGDDHRPAATRAALTAIVAVFKAEREELVVRLSPGTTAPRLVPPEVPHGD